MDRDVESRIDRLGTRYLQAQAEMESRMPTVLPSGRSLRGIRKQAIDTITQLRRDRRAPSGSLVKLAYVRGMRSVDPKSRMSEAHEREVAFLEKRLDHELRRIETGAFQSIKGQLRRMKLAETLSQYDYPDATLAAITHTQRYPLERHACVSIRTIVDTAMRAGRLSMQPPTQYDIGENVNG